MMTFISKFFDRFFVVLFAFIFLQFPAFFQQYEGQLTGHVNELKWQMAKMEEIALKSGKTLNQYINKFKSDDDFDISEQGYLMQTIQIRWEKLSWALIQLKKASFITKPFYFFFFSQWDIFKSTIEAFKPGFMLNLESLIYGLVGMLFGYLFFQFLAKIFRTMFNESQSSLIDS